MRLARYLALAGVASRREAEKIIKTGQVTVNGVRQIDLGKSIDEVKDVIRYKGKEIKFEPKVYYLVNKPKGYVCSRRRYGNDKLVTDLVPSRPAVYPAGRLDKDSCGLIILTNDGQLTLKLTHPRYQTRKVYQVGVNQILKSTDINNFKNGVRLREGLAKFDTFKKITDKKFIVSLHQGWNRQIRRMCEALGLSVVELKRLEENNFKLGKLKEGDYLELQASDFKL